jgi:hypothetical protein
LKIFDKKFCYLKYYLYICQWNERETTEQFFFSYPLLKGKDVYKSAFYAIKVGDNEKEKQDLR